jgi:hypothetical protein
VTQPPPEDPFAPPQAPPVDPWYVRDQPPPPPAWGQQAPGQPAWGQPAWGQAAYPYVPGPTINTLAIIALAVSLLCVPASIVLAIIALVQINRRQQGGKWLAIGALIVDGLIIAVIGLFITLGVNGVFDELGRRDVNAAASSVVGTCSRAQGLGEHVLVPCSRPHDEEVFWVASLDEGDYPGDTSLDDEANGVCTQHFRTYVGRAYEESDLDYDYYAPTEEEWSQGEHRVICVITTDLATTSARNSGR